MQPSQALVSERADMNYHNHCRVFVSYYARLIYRARSSNCQIEFCSSCDAMAPCTYCGEGTCEDCMFQCDHIGCSKSSCRICMDNYAECLRYCTQCDEVLCIDCRAEKYRGRCVASWGDNCSQCARIIAPALLNENEKLRQELQG